MIQAVPPSIIMSMPEQRQNDMVEQLQQQEEPLTKTVEIQTKFRESDTQTDP